MKIKKLVLNKETIRELSDSELLRVAGGETETDPTKTKLPPSPAPSLCNTACLACPTNSGGCITLGSECS